MNSKPQMTSKPATKRRRTKSTTPETTARSSAASPTPSIAPSQARSHQSGADPNRFYARRPPNFRYDVPPPPQNTVAPAGSVNPALRCCRVCGAPEHAPSGSKRVPGAGDAPRQPLAGPSDVFTHIPAGDEPVGQAHSDGAGAIVDDADDWEDDDDKSGDYFDRSSFQGSDGSEGGEVPADKDDLQLAPSASPKHRIRDPQRTSRPPGFRTFVLGLDPNEQTCLLTRCSTLSGLQIAHLFGRGTSQRTIDAVEWAWNMPYDTFYVDSRYNTIILQATEHILMDRDHWLVLPHWSEIVRLQKWMQDNAANRDDLDMRREIREVYEENEIFQCSVLPLKMENFVIMRYVGAKTTRPPPVKTHPFPFSTLIEEGMLKTHCRPYFMAYEAGHKLRKLIGQGKAVTSPVIHDLAKIAQFGFPSAHIMADEETTADEELMNRNIAMLSALVKFYDDSSSALIASAPKKTLMQWRRNGPVGGA
ncbi:hypothetical protein MKEN_00245800 [Mycena kentingensis (nom. inval.)]|nr:hypothetical protein MKEN_00245800 [Mycena kentingensis (nom. inval.)]